MLTTTLAATTLLLGSALAQTAAPTFSVYTMQVFDERIPSVQHNISFNVNAPGNPKEQGGDDYGLCSFGWADGDSPSCWSRCDFNASGTANSNPDATYYAHLDNYNGADYFNITLWQGYPGYHNAGQIIIRSGQDGYYCSHGAQTTICSIGAPFTPIQVPSDEAGPGCEPYDEDICD